MLYYLKNIFRLFKKATYIFSSKKFENYLRQKGVTIGENVRFWSPRTTRIDLSRPCLIEIGNNVDINTHFCIMTHDFSNFVFRNYFNDYITNSGIVKLGNNIYIGTNVTILRGVTIGDNCIIGAGSIVTKNIPSNSVAVGVPCRVVSSLEEYYDKRKGLALEEAKQYVKRFRVVHKRNPNISELHEEWVFFVDKHNMKQYPEIPVRQKIGPGYNLWLDRYTAPYKSYEDFMESIN